MDIKQVDAHISQYLRTATFPVGIKLLKDTLPENVKTAKQLYKHPLAVCQAITAARRVGRTVGFAPEDHKCPLSHIIFGFKENPDFSKNGELVYPLYTKDVAAGAVTAAAEMHLEAETFKSMVVAPLHRADFTPDIVIVYGNAAQIVRLIQGALFHSGGSITSGFMGRCACASYIAYPYKTKKCNVVLPGGGERVFGMTCDDELAFAIPWEEVENVMTGLKATHDSGVARIPTPFFGVTADAVFPPTYSKLAEYCGI